MGYRFVVKGAHLNDAIKGGARTGGAHTNHCSMCCNVHYWTGAVRQEIMCYVSLAPELSRHLSLQLTQPSCPKLRVYRALRFSNLF